MPHNHGIRDDRYLIRSSQALGISQAALNGVMAGVIGTNMIPEVIVAVVSNMALATALSSRYVGIAQQA